jgi:hypothetical protein
MVEKQLGFITPEMEIVGCQVHGFGGDEWVSNHPSEVTKEQVVEEQSVWFLNHPGVFIKRSLLQAVPYIQQPICSDLHLWYRLLEQGHVIHNNPECLVDYRIHAKSLSRANHVKSIAESKYLLRNFLSASPDRVLKMVETPDSICACNCTPGSPIEIVGPCGDHVLTNSYELTLIPGINDYGCVECPNDTELYSGAGDFVFGTMVIFSLVADYSGVLRFPNVQIPQGAVVRQAALIISTPSENVYTINLNACIYGGSWSSGALPALAADLDDGTTWANSVVSWRINETTSIFTAPDVSCLISEIVQQPGWISGDDLIFWFCAQPATTLLSGTASLILYWDPQFLGVPDGGFLVGSSAQSVATYTNTPSGGWLDGGTATPHRTTHPQMLGGLLLGGTAHNTWGYEPSGGVLVGGEAVPQQALHFHPSGGFTIGAPVFPSGFRCRCQVVIPAGMVKENLTKFVAIIKTTVATKPPTADFTITDANNHALPTSVIEWDSASGFVAVAFKCNLMASTDNLYYLNYWRG